MGDVAQFPRRADQDAIQRPAVLDAAKTRARAFNMLAPGDQPKEKRAIAALLASAEEDIIDWVADRPANEQRFIDIVTTVSALISSRTLGPKAAWAGQMLRRARESSVHNDKRVTIEMAVPDVMRVTAERAGIDLSKFWMPPKYRMLTSDSGDAERSLRCGDTEVLSTMLIVESIASNVETLEQTLRLSWYDDAHNCWRSVHRPVVDIMDSRTIQRVLSGVGVPLTSESARRVVAWLDAFRRANAHSIAIEHITSHIGWLTVNGEEVFVLPNRVLTASDGAKHKARKGKDKVGVDKEDDKNAARNEDEVSAKDIGEPITAQQVNLAPPKGFGGALKMYRTYGTVDMWLNVFETTICNYPLVYLGVYTSIASAFMEHVFPDAEGFTLDYGAETGAGKTTAIIVSASVWGYPALSGGILTSWEDTLVDLMNRMGVLKSVVLCMDESQRAKHDPDKIERVIYAVSNSVDRGRGARDGGSREKSSWRLLGISSGENSILAFTRAGGVGARLLPVRDRPTGAANTTNKAAAEHMAAVVRDHYGHYGPMVVQFILDNRGEWPFWRKLLLEQMTVYANRYSSRVAGNATLGRVLNHLAMLDVVARILHVQMPVALPPPKGFALGDGVVTNPAILMMERLLTAGDMVLPRSLKYFYMFREYMVSNVHRFKGRELNSNQVPQGGWLGTWSAEEDYTEIYVAHDAFLREMRALTGLQAVDDLLVTWRDQEYIESTEQSGHLFDVPIFDRGQHVGTARCIKITREKMTALLQ